MCSRSKEIIRLKTKEEFREALQKELNDILWVELGLPIVPLFLNLNIQKENGEPDVRSNSLTFAFEEDGENKEIVMTGNFPFFEVEDIYKVFQRKQDIEKVAKLVLLCAGMPDQDSALPPEAIEPYESRIFYTAVNKDRYAGMLKNIPHRMVHDFAVIYHLKHDERSSRDRFSSIITNDMAQIMGENEESLYKRAQENTKYLLHAKTTPMKDFICENYKMCGMSDEEAEKKANEETKNLPKTYIVSGDNDFFNRNIYGTAFLLENEFLQNFSMEFDNDLVILPVSTYGFVVVKASDIEIKDADTLASIIRDMYVPEEEQLSDSVYYYSQMKNELRLATTGRSIHDITGFLARMKKEK